MNWEAITVEQLSEDLLSMLFNNRIAAIKIKNVLSDNACDQVLQRIKSRGGFDAYEKDDYSEVDRIGIGQIGHDNTFAGKASYFAKVSQYNALRKSLTSDSGDILLKVMDYVRSAWSGEVDIAFEETHKAYYYAGVIRSTKKSLLHFDWVQYDAPGWTVGGVSAQITWILCLQVGTKGGVTRVYKRFWQPEDERYAIPNSFGHDHSVVKGCDVVEILPEKGQLVLFNPRNFHEVEATEGEIERVTVNSYIGLFADSKKLVFWS